MEIEEAAVVDGLEVIPVESLKDVIAYLNNEIDIAPAVGRVAEAIAAGRDVALVSDAGTPGISDPGFLLVRKCVEEGIDVETLPGATALIPAVVQSGFPCDRFCFEGFLPQKKGRLKRLTELATEPRTLVLYESPYRVVKCLEQIAEVMGAERRVAVVREITKRFEQTVRGTVAEVIAHFKEHEPKGEFVIVVAGYDPKAERDDEEDEDQNQE